jgi:beta-galactosidase
MYFFPLSKHTENQQVTSYDTEAPFWATTIDEEWTGEDKSPFVMGEFVWTGFDYMGEPTPFGASRSSYFGIMDLAGFKKDRFYLYQSRWRPDFPMAHILPHWNWPDRVGQATPVFVYTSGDEAELFLNGKSLGRQKKDPYTYRLKWMNVLYEPGELSVVAYKNGKVWSRDSVKTTGAPARLTLQPDRSIIAADGKDLSYVTLKIVDKDGLQVPLADNPIRFSVDGPGEIVAVDNGDASDMTSFQDASHKAFNGLTLAIIRALPGQPGTITVHATSDGLPPVETVLTTR